MLIPYNIEDSDNIQNFYQEDLAVRKKIREIKTMLADVPAEQRISLPKEELEHLMFLDMESSNMGQPVTVRYLNERFFGYLDLSKIDLSEIDFNNVYWIQPLSHYNQFHNCRETAITLQMNRHVFLSENEKMQLGIENEVLNFSGSNANIDFSTGYFPSGALEHWQASSTTVRVLEGYNFEGTNLSSSNIEKTFSQIENCNFNNVGNLNFEDKSLGNRLVRNCSFIGTTVNGFQVTNEIENAEVLESVNYYDKKRTR